MNNSVFRKAMKNIGEDRAIKLVTSKKRKKLFGIRNKLSYYKDFQRKLAVFRNEKTQILINKPVYLGLSILELS